MKWSKWLEEWGLNSLKLNIGFLELDFVPQVADKAAAWDLYVELLTRVATQYLDPDHGDESTALKSIFSLFELTRATMKHHGPDCSGFAHVAVVVLNQVVRPFTAKWHRLSIAGAFDDPVRCVEFRAELSELQADLRTYTAALGRMAGVEDPTVFGSPSTDKGLAM
jgi:hypothetical protein